MDISMEISMEISMDGYRDFGHIHGYCGYQKLNFQGYIAIILHHLI